MNYEKSIIGAKDFKVNEFFENERSYKTACKEEGETNTKKAINRLAINLQIIRNYLNRYKENEFKIIITC